jgi:hypothetical protein
VRRRTQVGAPATVLASVRVDEFAHEARELLTIGELAKAWDVFASGGGVETELDPCFKSRGLEGAIVRLRPPAHATDARIVEVEELARIAGAIAVKVERRRNADAAPVVAGVVIPIRRTLDEILEAESMKHGEEMRAIAHDLAVRALEIARASCPKPIVPESSAPLHLARVEAANWFRYRAIDLALRPMVYGVVAQLENNAERSNWIGKSTFLAVQAFLFFGWHPADYDDAWLMLGDEGFVRGTYSDGSTIERSKRKGQPTKVTFIRADGRKLVGDEAKDAIRRFVGLSESDYFASAFVKQKQLERLVAGRASETAKVVSAWLELAPIREAHRALLARLDKVMTGDFDLAAMQARDEETRAGSFRTFNVESLDALEALLGEQRTIFKSASEELQAMRARVEASKRIVADYHERVRKEARLRVTAGNVEVLEKQIAELPDVAALEARVAELEPLATAAAKAWQEASSATREAEKDADRKKRVAGGGFDGHCPVAPPLVCPVVDKINANREPAKKAYDVALVEVTARGKAAAALAPAKSKLERELLEARIAARAATDKRAELATALKEAKETAAKLEDFVVGDPPAQFDAAEIDPIVHKLGEAKVLVDRLERATVEVKAVEERMKTRNAQRETNAVVVAELRAAASILGPGGAQKAYAAAELGAIEAGANAVLEETCADLRVAIAWGYESPTALAPACGTCGAGFNSTSRAKSCPRCGSARGPKIEEEVRISTSKISGAANDLAGVAVQIAAAAWLRDARGSAWRSMAIDEPFGALDVEHARALGAHLATLLAGRHGFRQAFVVAHSTAAMDAMPARLMITGRADGSSTIEEAKG